MHCKSYKNDCYGENDCFCECQGCLEADPMSHFNLFKDDEDIAEYMSHSDADPGL
jgi:hypothetical protein